MNKSLKKAVSLVAALTMAVSAIPAVGVSANSNDVYTSTYVWYNVKTEKYYDNKDEAIEASSAADVIHGYSINYNYSVNFSLEYPYYSTYTKKYYPTFFAATAVSRGDESRVIYGGPDGVSVYDANHQYYSSYTRKYYSTYQEALSHSKKVASYVIKTSGSVVFGTNTVYVYYSSYTKRYYATYSDALAASKGISSYVTKVNYGTTVGSGNYYNSKTGQWYATLSEALAAYNNDADYVYYSGGSYTVYYYNGNYYASAEEANAAGAAGTYSVHTYTGRYVPSSAYTSIVYYAPYYGYYNGYYNGYYYGYPYYYGYYGYPYYTYYTSTATTASEGVPYLKGYKTKHSWSNLASYVKKCKSGSVVEIVMNGATSVSDTFMSALKGRNVTAVFYMDNGAKWTVKGTNVTAANNAALNVTYGTEVVPSKLRKKAAASAVTTGEVTVGTGSDSLGFKGSCTVKFSSKRANMFAKVYIYDKDENTLTLVSKSITDDNGYVTFTASKNGTYLIVLS